MESEKRKLTVDVQSLLQWIILTGSIVFFLVRQSDRITTLEVQEKSDERLQMELVQTQKELAKALQEHLVIASKALTEQDHLINEMNLFKNKPSIRTQGK